MVFTYRCPEHGSFVMGYRVGQAPGSLRCSVCRAVSPRHFGPDTIPVIQAHDPFRAFDLSPRKEAAQVQQQRYLDAPHDRFEAKRMERDLGRVYVGDDSSGMSAAARRGIERAKEQAS